jgi:hypothetical protein
MSYYLIILLTPGILPLLSNYVIIISSKSPAIILKVILKRKW